jgi:RimJ/RimL family protein N-acetyltransferase
MTWLAPVTLQGTHAVLLPLRPSQKDELSVAVQDGELHQLWYTAIPTPEKMRAEIDRRLDLFEKGTMLPFAVKSTALNRVIGMTTYMNVDQLHKRVEIGSTWYAKSVQRTPLNTECKLLLLGHAFEKMDCIAVEFRTSPAAPRSCAWAPSRMVFCATTSAMPMVPCAIPWCSASPPPSGRR